MQELFAHLPSWFGDALFLSLGASMGSFLGVVSCRLPEGLSIATPPSYCRRCGHPIAWYDNIPLLGYLLTRGECRRCGGHYSAGHLFFEIFTAFLTWIVWRRFGWTWELPGALILVWSLTAITVIDAREQIVPDAISLPGIGLGLFCSFLPGGVSPLDSFLGASAGMGLLLAVRVIYARLRGREGMGGGDVKLLAMIGAFLGIKATMVALFAGSITGAVVGGGYLLLSRSSRHTPIPFGPFLALGAFLSLLDSEGIVRGYGSAVRWLVR